jgi:hypothetical protein
MKNTNLLLVRYKTKRKEGANFTLKQAMKGLRGSGSVVLLFLEHPR